MVTQIQKIIAEGHYVFPHIHPHWLDAVPHQQKGQWSLTDYSKYRFHNISKQQQEELFDKSVKLLYEIILPVSPTYKINAYRAGGWSIQPFSDFRSRLFCYQCRIWNMSHQTKPNMI